LVSEDDRKLVLKTGDQPRPVEVLKANIKAKRLSKVSIMPENVLDGYSIQQISDLMAYVMSKPR
jgi:hypothetical protein